MDDHRIRIITLRGAYDFLTLSMRHPEPPDWIDLFIGVLRALFFQH